MMFNMTTIVNLNSNLSPDFTANASASTAAALTELSVDMDKQSLPTGTLYVLATPIGNRADLTVRAVYVLQIADVIAAEDTRVAGHLLHSLQIHNKPFIACDAHREHAVISNIIDRLANGERVVLCSDAGTPAISDPGAKVVAAVREAGYRVLPIPGVSSLSTAISASGLVGSSEASFTFHAFSPNKGKPRTDFYYTLAHTAIPQIWFEAPHRMVDAFERLAQLSPTRMLCIARELTKQFESIVVLPCADAPQWLAEKNERHKGEFVLILGAYTQTTLGDINTNALNLAQQLSTELPASKAAALAALHYGTNRSDIYTALLAAKQKQ
jgi:16S rRNA (cytidine1402-2'-O)-methyltransferase